MKIFVQTAKNVPHGAQTIELEIEDWENFRSIKEVVRKRTGVHPDLQRLSIANRTMWDARPLKDCGIKDRSVFYLELIRERHDGEEEEAESDEEKETKNDRTDTSPSLISLPTKSSFKKRKCTEEGKINLAQMEDVERLEKKVAGCADGLRFHQEQIDALKTFQSAASQPLQSTDSRIRALERCVFDDIGETQSPCMLKMRIMLLEDMVGKANQQNNARLQWIEQVFREELDEHSKMLEKQIKKHR